MKIKALISIVLSTCVLAGGVYSASADDEYNVSTGVTSEGSPLGLHGFDPYAFLSLENRIEGQAEYAATYDGVTYYFASKSNRDMFQSDPAAYLPQFGGFCTFAVAKGKKFDGDPVFADIQDGKLYLFVNGTVFEIYQKDKAGTIQAAYEKWPEIRAVAADKL